ncbi:MAG: hypothetical protein IJ876_05190 [Elusimicrobiaceae bacterium]|nr:hypothetical protein [Elusimicrobiaceae bacterium]
MIKKALVAVCGVLVCSACGAPSLRYKYEVNKLAAQGKFDQAAAYVNTKAKSAYSGKDILLYELDRGTLLHDAQNPTQSDEHFTRAQQDITNSYTKSVSASVRRLFVNDLTTPYYAANYETALTFFYRAMNFLQQNDIASAAVEARKAVFFLDHLRADKKSGYNDDPFVQYMSSLIFELTGELSDARISRTNAVKAYQKRGWVVPEFSVPQNWQDYGEVIIIHYVGQIPLKKSQTMQIAWHKALALARSPVDDGGSISPEVENAIRAGLTGSSITISYPVLEEQNYYVAGSMLQTGTQRVPLQKMSDVSELIKQDLQEKLPAIWFRLATRAVLRQVAAVQARHAIDGSQDGKKWGSAGWLAEMAVGMVGALAEKADTRQWFTLPAEIFMTRAFVSPGTQDIRLLFTDRNGNIIGTYTFENVAVPKGGRVFLHHRTAY